MDEARAFAQSTILESCVGPAREVVGHSVSRASRHPFIGQRWPRTPASCVRFALFCLARRTCSATATPRAR
eukprot:4590471-Lingulodinium_polyedra.AAC.1